MLVLAKDSGIAASKPINIKQELVNCSFRLVGTEAAIAAMTAIVIEQPSAEWDQTVTSSYSGDWEKKVYGGTDIVLDADNRVQTAFGTGRVRINKTADEQVGVEFDRN